MVTVSSAFMSSRRERINLRVSPASSRAFKTAAPVDDLRAFDATGFDNTDVVRDQFLSLYRERRISASADYTTHVGLMVSIFQSPRSIRLPRSILVPQFGR